MQPSKYTFISVFCKAFNKLYQFKQEDLLWNMSRLSNNKWKIKLDNYALQ